MAIYYDSHLFSFLEISDGLSSNYPGVHSVTALCDQLVSRRLKELRLRIAFFIPQQCYAPSAMLRLKPQGLAVGAMSSEHPSSEQGRGCGPPSGPSFAHRSFGQPPSPLASACRTGERVVLGEVLSRIQLRKILRLGLSPHCETVAEGSRHA